jgi:uncharacterized membrane protein YcaP (DUF421 family)
MMARAFVLFFIALVLIRLGGVRIFGKKSSFDDIIVIMLGAVLSRAVVGASPFGATVAAAAVMILLHRLVAILCIRSKKIENIIKGKPIILYKNGKVNHTNLYKCSLSESDLYESLRLETQKLNFDEVEIAYMENNGRVSFVMKK